MATAAVFAERERLIDDAARHAAAAYAFDVLGSPELAARLRGAALWKLGRLLHMMQDLAFHRGIDMKYLHTGCAGSTTLKWTLGLGFPELDEARLADIRDAMPWKFPLVVQLAKRYTSDVLSDIEGAVVDLGGDLGPAAVKFLKTGRQ